MNKTNTLALFFLLACLPVTASAGESSSPFLNGLHNTYTSIIYVENDLSAGLPPFEL
jgi:hypothetical protein